MIFIVLNSIGIALVGTMGLVMLFRVALSFGADTDPELQGLVVILGFIVLFLASLLILVNRHMPTGWLASQEKKAVTAANEYTPPKEK